MASDLGSRQLRMPVATPIMVHAGRPTGGTIASSSVLTFPIGTWTSHTPTSVQRHQQRASRATLNCLTGKWARCLTDSNAAGANNVSLAPGAAQAKEDWSDRSPFHARQGPLRESNIQAAGPGLNCIACASESTLCRMA